MATFKLLTGAQAINKAIKSIATRGKKLDQDIHCTAVSVLDHVRQHGDTTVCVSLIDAMPRSGRRKALIHWVNSFAPIDVRQDKAGKVTAKLKPVRESDGSDFKIADAIDMPFWDFTPEKAVAPMTFERLISYVTKHAGDIEGVTDDEVAAMASALAAVAEKHKPSAKAA